MKVLHIINSLGTGGAEKLIVDSLPLYIECSVDVDLLLLNGQRTPFYTELEKKFAGNIFHSKVSSLYDPRQVIEIKKRLFSYDLIHVHLFPALYWVALSKVLFVSDVPLIFTEHSTNNKRINNFYFCQIDKLIYKQYKHITAITPQVKNVLLSNLNMFSQKVSVIFNGIDITRLSIASPYSRKHFFDIDQMKVLIQVSSFSPQKDQETVIKALKYLPSNYVLLLVGDGDLKMKNIELVTHLSLNKRVRFLGIRMDVPELLKTADIVVQSSNWEGFGLAAVEGMAAGKPVIASDVDGLKNIVEDSGLVFTRGDEKELAQKILSLEDEEFYNKIAFRCLEKSKEYAIRKMVDSFADLYKTILNE